jgi:uncharacterized protein with FMN-binding domain
MSPARRALPVALATAAVAALLAAVRPRPPALPHAPALSAAADTAALHGVSRRPAHGHGRVRSGLSVPQSTPFSYLQVRVSFTGHELTRVETVELTGTGARTQAINARAEPILRAEALRAGGAGIDTVTGATYTSRAYREALRSAIARARR